MCFFFGLGNFGECEDSRGFRFNCVFCFFNFVIVVDRIYGVFLCRFIVLVTFIGVEYFNMGYRRVVLIYVGVFFRWACKWLGGIGSFGGRIRVGCGWEMGVESFS